MLNLFDDAEFGLQLGLRDTLLAFFRIAEPELPTGEEALGAVLGKLRDAISVQRRGLTFLIAISARSGRPEFAAQIANVRTFHAARNSLAPVGGTAVPNSPRHGLTYLQNTARERQNIFAALMEAVKTHSLGQISHALYDVGGEYRRNM